MPYCIPLGFSRKIPWKLWIGGTMATQVMHESRRRESGTGDHRWVAAALVELGTSRSAGGRAEHAARTGRHVLPIGTRLQVLEVYCGSCRVSYESHSALMPCTGVPVRRVPSRLRGHGT
jgi:hypothetical protein